MSAVDDFLEENKTMLKLTAYDESWGGLAMLVLELAEAIQADQTTTKSKGAE